MPTSTLASLGSLLSGIGFIATAALAWRTYHSIHKRNIYEQWVTGFRAIYQEFWKEPDIAEVRRWITSDEEYGHLREVLVKRNSSRNNNLEQGENLKLDKLDNFLALIFRVTSFDREEWDAKQKELWASIYETYWIRKLYSRSEIRIYISENWKPLYKRTFTKEIEKYILEDGDQVIPKNGGQT